MKHVVAGDHPLHLQAAIDQDLMSLADLGMAQIAKLQERAKKIEHYEKTT